MQRVKALGRTKPAVRYVHVVGVVGVVSRGVLVINRSDRMRKAERWSAPQKSDDGSAVAVVVERSWWAGWSRAAMGGGEQREREKGSRRQHAGTERPSPLFRRQPPIASPFREDRVLAMLLWASSARYESLQSSVSRFSIKHSTTFTTSFTHIITIITDTAGTIEALHLPSAKGQAPRKTRLPACRSPPNKTRPPSGSAALRCSVPAEAF